EVGRARNRGARKRGRVDPDEPVRVWATRRPAAGGAARDAERDECNGSREADAHEIRLALLLQSWHRQITIPRLAANLTQVPGRPSEFPSARKTSRHAWPASLRCREKSACPVRLSGRMAAPMIDLVAEICGSRAGLARAQYKIPMNQRSVWA